MKKLSLLLLSTLMAVCLFTSCSDDDDDWKEQVKKNKMLIGTWDYTGTTVEVTPENGSQEAKEAAIAHVKSVLEVQDDAHSINFSTIPQENHFIYEYSTGKKGWYEFSRAPEIITMYYEVDEGDHQFRDDSYSTVLDGNTFILKASTAQFRDGVEINGEKVDVGCWVVINKHYKKRAE